MTQYNERYALPFMIGKDTRVHFNVNPMGAGKTEQNTRLLHAIRDKEPPEGYSPEMVGNLLRLLDDGATRVMCIGPRVTFEQQLKLRFAEFGARLYLEVAKDDTSDPDFVIYQWESLHKSIGKKKAAILLLDESEATLTQMTAGSNAGRQKQNLAAIVAIVRAADLIVAPTHSSAPAQSR
jgi:hypothetical protein